MTTSSIHDEDIQQTIKQWIKAHGEIFVNIHHPHSGSSGENYFFRSAAHVDALIASLSPKSVLIAYRQRQFPIRIALSPAHIPAILETITEGSWYGIVDLAPYPEVVIFYGSGNTHQELFQDIQDLMGGEYGIGIEPLEPSEYWNFENTNDIIVAQSLIEI